MKSPIWIMTIYVKNGSNSSHLNPRISQSLRKNKEDREQNWKRSLFSVHRHRNKITSKTFSSSHQSVHSRQEPRNFLTNKTFYIVVFCVILTAQWSVVRFVCFFNISLSTTFYHSPAKFFLSVYLFLFCVSF